MISQSQCIKNAIAVAIVGLAAFPPMTPSAAQSSSSPVQVRQLHGEPGEGAGPGFASGWIDLSPAEDFRAGDRLRILVGGTARRVLVRLLPRGVPPTLSAGILGAPVDVPASRQIEVEIADPKKDIWQISVHGGTHPFKVPLGADNGPATLVSVWLVR